MSREKQLAKNTLIISFGTFLPKLINIITLPIITARLTKVEYGQYDLITTLVLLVLPIATLQIQSAAFRFLIDCREDSIQTKKVITTILCYAGVASILGVVCVSFVLSKMTILLKVLISLYLLVDIFLAIIQQIVRGLSLNKVYSISTIINSIVNLVGIIIIVQFIDKGLEGVLLSMVVATIFGIAYLVTRIRIWNYVELSFFSIGTLKELLSYSWPMIPNNLSNWVLKLSDRLVITTFLGVEATAVYAVANKIPNLFITVQATFIYAWQENASLAVNDKDAEEYFSNIFSNIFNMLVGVMALAIAVTPVMFGVLIRGDYAEAYGQIPILFMAMMFSSVASILGGFYVAHKRTKSVGISTTLAAICNVAIDLLLVKDIGIYAGSISTLISYLLLVIYRMIDVLKFQKIQYKCKEILSWIFILSIMCIICQRRLLWLNILNMFIGVVIAYISNRILINDFIKKIKVRLIKWRKYR